MEWVVTAFLFLLFIFCGMSLIRIHFVSEMTKKLLTEESDWLYYHWQDFSNSRREGPYFKRHRRLPSFAVMIYKFWRPVSSFERELGPIEQYYPFK